MSDRSKEFDSKELDEKNKRARQVNPAYSGIRSGNPQLDPRTVEKDQTKTLPPRRK